jgi:hypothetical protein
MIPSPGLVSQSLLFSNVLSTCVCRCTRYAWVFLDVIESVNVVVNSAGQVVNSEVLGALRLRTYLTGMPECKLGLNDKVMLAAQNKSAKVGGGAV